MHQKCKSQKPKIELPQAEMPLFVALLILRQLSLRGGVIDFEKSSHGTLPSHGMKFLPATVPAFIFPWELPATRQHYTPMLTNNIISILLLLFPSCLVNTASTAIYDNSYEFYFVRSRCKWRKYHSATEFVHVQRH